MNTLPRNTNIVIIEDEQDATQLLKDFLNDMSFDNIRIFDNATNGLDAIKIRPPDILFLDINLFGEYNGLDVLEAIDFYKIHTHVIITTAYTKYVEKVVRYSPIDFLLKPIDIDELKSSLRKVEQHFFIHNNPILTPSKITAKDFIEINSNNEINYFRLDEIAYLEARGSYTDVFLICEKKVTITQNLGKVAKQLPDNQFVRVGRKNIINKIYLKKLIKKSQQIVLEYNGFHVRIPTSKKYFL